MSILTVENMSHGFGDREIFKGVSFRLLKGEHVGLVGANGEGKSTFMNIITDKIIPDSGNIHWSSKISVGYLDQHTNLKEGKSIRDTLKEAFSDLFGIETELNNMYNQMSFMDIEQMNKTIEKTTELQDFLINNEFYSIDSKVESVALGLGLRDIGLDKDVSKLSGGQRTKVLLAKLLLEKPDILLLDEPTNYLDENHIEWLKKYLQSYENAFMLISHDLDFLNSVVNVICHLENKSLKRYVGNYESFIKVYEANKLQLRAAYNRQVEEILKLEEYIAKNKYRASTSGMAKSRQKKLDKIDRIEIAKHKPNPKFKFIESKESGKVIFETKNLVIGYDKPLSKPINIKMERGQKIAVIGSNGIGKTTLLKSLMGINKPVSGEVKIGEYQEIGYFEQETKIENDNTALEEIWNEFYKCNRYEIRSMLARCGLTNEHIDSKVNILSGGEQSKIRLCKLINKPSNILILDEPTNHLDIDAKNELKKALKEYKGSLILVCHERDFYKDIVSDVLNCENLKI
ncbi:ABC-F family ATP-binding cassette domain-containing protein [Clostridium sp. CCUG 7971]|uniref:ABC-F family ATP-binding cassette domain-containing protein n=1 Tax=Clostridium sp. CCUG 7971 TaxID=2811414 RepID=UPI001ABAAFFE|nr:ABC-F family ATP-binding cassette domain-containing protein [Clostridium sp. CCUG 7971]MBO3445248.1 ABC-F family ATP-binding cassette domain-containing protein [Clostridium sp. CCUG 7971]